MKNPFYAGERQVKEDFVRPLGKGFGVYSEAGKLLGKHPSRAQANAQLAAIEAAKARRGDGLVEDGKRRETDHLAGVRRRVEERLQAKYQSPEAEMPGWINEQHLRSLADDARKKAQAQEQRKGGVVTHKRLAALHTKAGVDHEEAAYALLLQHREGIAHALSARAHATDEGHIEASVAHAVVSDMLRKQASEHERAASDYTSLAARYEAGNAWDQEQAQRYRQLVPVAKAAAQRLHTLADDHQRRATDHAMLGSRTGVMSWPEEGASEAPPLPQAQETAKEGEFALRKSEEYIKQAAGHRAMAALHREADKNGGEGWDESKHPRDEEGRFI